MSKKLILISSLVGVLFLLLAGLKNSAVMAETKIGEICRHTLRGSINEAQITDGNIIYAGGHGTFQHGQMDFDCEVDYSIEPFPGVENWGGIGHSVAATANGEYYVVGHTVAQSLTMSTDTIQPNHGGGSYDLVIYKVGADGQPLWSTYLGDEANEYVRSTRVDEDGNLIIAGTVYGSSIFSKTIESGQQGFLAKISPDGEALLDLKMLYVGPNDVNEMEVRKDSSIAYVSIERNNQLVIELIDIETFEKTLVVQPTFTNVGSASIATTDTANFYVGTATDEGAFIGARLYSQNIFTSTTIGGPNDVIFDIEYSGGMLYTTGRTRSEDFPGKDPNDPRNVFMAIFDASTFEHLHTEMLGEGSNQQGHQIDVAEGVITVAGGNVLTCDGCGELWVLEDPFYVEPVGELVIESNWPPVVESGTDSTVTISVTNTSPLTQSVSISVFSTDILTENFKFVGYEANTVCKTLGDVSMYALYVCDSVAIPPSTTNAYTITTNTTHSGFATWTLGAWSSGLGQFQIEHRALYGTLPPKTHTLHLPLIQAGE